MNKNTLTAILFGTVAVLALAVIAFSIKLRMDDSDMAANTPVQEEVPEQEEAEITPEVVEEEIVEPEVVTVTIQMVRTTQTVNVRAGAGIDTSKIGLAETGSEFELVEAEENGWSRIIYEGSEAYIKSEYLETFEIEVEVTEEEEGEEPVEEDADTEE